MLLPRPLSKPSCLAPLQLAFPEESLPRGKGEYILGYYSNNYSCMVGVTEPLQISLPSSDRFPSPTDSSSSPSDDEEDDSTLGLLGPKSRSPSPGKTKRHRSRSPSLAVFQELLLRSSSRDQGASRSPSPQGRRGSRGAAATAARPGEIPSIQLSKDSSQRRSKSRELAGAAAAESAPPRLQVSRADPRNLGLLPAVCLEALDQVLSHRRESADQGLPPPRRVSPTSPTAGLSTLFGTSPQEGAALDPQGPSSHSRDAGR